MCVSILLELQNIWKFQWNSKALRKIWKQKKKNSLKMTFEYAPMSLEKKSGLSLQCFCFDSQVAYTTYTVTGGWNFLLVQENWWWFRSHRICYMWHFVSISIMASVLTASRVCAKVFLKIDPTQIKWTAFSQLVTLAHCVRNLPVLIAGIIRRQIFVLLNCELIYL